MLTQAIPKLPMRLKSQTKSYYIGQLGFMELADYGDYLLLEKDGIEIHFFEFKTLDPLENYGQIYIRTNQIEALYAQLLETNVTIHPNAPLQRKPWGQMEFSLLDPDHNLITFGQAVNPIENIPAY
ncbi:MAG: bleomycin resistance protein [Bacteroidota bacterium]